MSISKLSPQMMSRSILIFTLVTSILHPLAMGKPNTFWSKRAGEHKFPGPVEEERTFYNPRDTKRNIKHIYIFRFLQSYKQLKFRETILPFKNPNLMKLLHRVLSLSTPPYAPRDVGEQVSFRIYKCESRGCDPVTCVIILYIIDIYYGSDE